MPTREQLIEQFGGWDNLPDYLKRGFEQQDAAEARRAQAQYDREAAEEAERAAREALRLPPARVWRVGQTALWRPPETVDQWRPLGYWIIEGDSWHGDYVPHDVFESQCFGTGPVKVQAVYEDMGHFQGSISPPAHYAEGEDPYLIGTARHYASQTDMGEAHVEHWRRVLAAFGVTGGRWYDLRRGVQDSDVQPLDPPMTAAEAQAFLDRGWGTWEPVVPVLRRLEANSETAPDNKKETGAAQDDISHADDFDCPKERLRDIVLYTKTYRGRRTKDGRPWVRALRKHADMPDITTEERDEAHRIATGGK